MMHTVESLERQLEQIDRMLEDCRGKSNLDRLVEHLQSRRNTTVFEMEKLKRQAASAEIASIP